MLGSSSSHFGQSSSSPFGSLSEFGQTCRASNNPFAPMPFGFGSQTGSFTFGGTSTGVFGAQTGSSVFGRTSTGVLGMQTAIGGQTGRSIFGGTPTGVFGPQTGSSQFGGTSTGGFGTQTAIDGQTGSSIFKGTSTGVFGPQTSCGTSTGVFGSQTRSGTSTGVFGSLTRRGTSTGAQSTIFRSTAAFMDQQCGSSMVAVPYVATRESEGGWKLVSISAMPAYKEKSHKELRWEASEKLESISAAYEDKSHEQIRWEYHHQLGDKGASSVFGQTSSPSISNPSSFAPASTNTTSTFNLPPLISNPSSFDPASTSTTFKFNPTAPSAAPTVPDDGTSSQMGFNEAAPPSVSVPFSSLPIQNNYGQFPATQPCSCTTSTTSTRYKSIWNAPSSASDVNRLQ